MHFKGIFEGGVGKGGLNVTKETLIGYISKLFNCFILKLTNLTVNLLLSIWLNFNIIDVCMYIFTAKIIILYNLK